MEHCRRSSRREENVFGNAIKAHRLGKYQSGYLLKLQRMERMGEKPGHCHVGNALLRPSIGDENEADGTKPDGNASVFEIISIHKLIFDVGMSLNRKYQH